MRGRDSLQADRFGTPKCTGRAKPHQAGGGGGKECAARHERSNDWPQGARSAPPNPDKVNGETTLTGFSSELILAHDEAAGLLVLVYLGHGGATALTLKPRDSVMPQAVPKRAAFLFLISKGA